MTRILVASFLLCSICLSSCALTHVQRSEHDHATPRSARQPEPQAPATIASHPSHEWNATQFENFIRGSDKVELIFHIAYSNRAGDHPPDKVVLTSQAQVARLTEEVKLVPKEPCRCEHIEGITFWKGTTTLPVFICGQCFDIIVDGEVARFKMPGSVYEQFSRLEQEHGKREGLKSP